MIIGENIVQGTPEWDQARLGIPTSSGFDKIITTKGEKSKQAEKYMYRLAAERITGVKEESYSSKHMERGMIVEAEARAFYELINDVEVQEVGICYRNSSKLYSCSPDGLVEDDGLLEIKCCTSAVHIDYLLKDKLPTEYFQQVQGQLYVTGRKWCDFFSFYPGIKPLQIRVEPDKKFFEVLGLELASFCSNLETITERIK